MQVNNTTRNRRVYLHSNFWRVLAGSALASSLMLGSWAFAQDVIDVDFNVIDYFELDPNDSPDSDSEPAVDGDSETQLQATGAENTTEETTPDESQEVLQNQRHNDTNGDDADEVTPDDDPKADEDQNDETSDDDLVHIMDDDDLIYLSMSGNVFDDCMLAPTLSASAQTSNQVAVTRGLQAVGVGTGDVAELIQELNGLISPTSQRAALDSLSGEVYGTLQSIGLQIGDRSLRVMSNRLINNRRFLADSNRMLLSGRSPQPPADATNSLVRGQSPAFGAAGWMQGYGVSGGWDSNGNSAGADFRLGGFAYGADLAGDETGVIGLSGGHAFTSFGTDRADEGRITSHQVGVYLLKNFDSVYGLGVFNYGHNNYDVTRLIQVGAINQLATSDSSGHQWGSYGEAGINLDTDYVRFQPFFGLQHVSLTNGSVFEGGAGGIGLHVGSNNTRTLQSHLGMRLILEVWHPTRQTVLRPYFNARWVADLLGDNQASVASLNGGPAGASWVVTGNHSGRHTAMLGPGFTAQLTDQISLFANYDLQVGDRFQSHTGNGGVLFEF